MKLGTFTPHGEIQCYGCHGPNFYGDPARPIPNYQDLCRDLGQVAAEDAVGTCQKCGCDISVREDVALLQKVAKLAGGTVYQSGGMTCTVAVPNPDTFPQVLIGWDGQYSVGVVTTEGDTGTGSGAGGTSTTLKGAVALAKSFLARE